MTTISDIIKNKYSSLSLGERKIGDKILNHEIDLTSHTITQAANICNVSPSLINKFCIKIGVSGWKVLKGLNFIDLRSERVEDDSIFSEEHMLIRNTFINRNKLIDAFMEKLYTSANSGSRLVMMCNGNTKRIAEAISYKLNKLGWNCSVYDFTESYISMDKNTILLFLSISGTINKFEHYQKQSKNKDHFLITFGNNFEFKGKKLCFDIYNNFGKSEKAFPIVTDTFLHLLLNRLVEKKLSNSPDIKMAIESIKNSQL